MSFSINKNGSIIANGSGINENLCTWGYALNPNIPNTAGNTILSITINRDFSRYTATTQGSNGGRYGYPVGNSGALVQGTIYTWSCELRSNIDLTFNAGRIGFEGGGMLSGSSVKIGKDWTYISNTFTQTTSQAFVIYPCGDLANGNYIDIRNLKIEVGSIATPFTIPQSETTRYVGINHGFFDNAPTIAKIGSGYAKGSELIEI